MAEAETAVIAAEETERHEDATDAAVEIARIEADTAECVAEATVEIAAHEAEARVGVAEAEAKGRDEWRDELRDVRETLASLAASQAAMAEAIALMATPSTLTPPSAPAEPTLVLVEEAPEAESPDASAEGPPEAETNTPPEPVRHGRIRRAM